MACTQNLGVRRGALLASTIVPSTGDSRRIAEVLPLSQPKIKPNTVPGLLPAFSHMGPVAPVHDTWLWFQSNNFAGGSPFASLTKC